MDHVNGATKKPVLFSIGSYSEKNRRVINKISRNPFSSNDFGASSEEPAQRRPVSLDLTDSPRYKTLPNPKKTTVTPKNFTVSNGYQKSEPIAVEIIEKPTCPPSSSGLKCCMLNGPDLEKPVHPPKLGNRSISLEPEQLRHSGRVALTIAAYQGEPRTPTRLEFLPPRQLSRSSSKASSSDASNGNTPAAEEPAEPIGFRLQNELVATLKRSNLKKRHDSTAENGSTNGSEDFKGASSEEKEPTEQNEISNEENEQTSADQKQQNNEKNGITNGNVKTLDHEPTKGESEIPSGSVKQLATELTKKITFRINPPENGEHACDKKV